MNVRMFLRREVPTPGLVSCDTHVHTFTLSRHGDASVEERVITLAGEGIELPIATDHNVLADYSDAARAMSVDSFFTPVIGCEVTTSEAHFNVFPIKFGSQVPDFRIKDWPHLMEAIRATPGVSVVILNHPRNIHNNFQPFAATNFNAVTGENLRGPEFTFDAAELINSSALQTDWMSNFRDWFALLNHGHHVTGVGSSDVHDVSRFIVGQGRSYVACNDSNPAKIDVEQACRSFREGRVLVSMGLLVQMKLESGGREYNVGDLAAGLGKEMNLHVTVLGPSWVQADRLELYANGAKIRERQLEHPATRHPIKMEFKWKLPRPQHDMFLVAIASGPGIRAPYWATARPYQPTSRVWESRVLGATNPIWVDADGDGQFSSARAYAEKLVRDSHGDIPALFRALAGYDAAVAAQVASLCKKAGRDLNDPIFQRPLMQAPLPVRNGFAAFSRALEQAANQRD